MDEGVIGLFINNIRGGRSGQMLSLWPLPVVSNGRFVNITWHFRANLTNYHGINQTQKRFKSHFA